MSRHEYRKIRRYNHEKICFDCGQRQCSETENKTLRAQNALMVEALAVADDALAQIHDTNAWINENEPNEWTNRVDKLTNDALDRIRALAISETEV